MTCSYLQILKLWEFREAGTTRCFIHTAFKFSLGYIMRKVQDDQEERKLNGPHSHLEQCFPNVFVRGPITASKNNQGPSYPCSRKYRMSGRQICKIKNLYFRTDFRQLRIHTGSIRNNALYYLTLFKKSVARFVATVGFLVFSTVIRNTHTHTHTHTRTHTQPITFNKMLFL